VRLCTYLGFLRLCNPRSWSFNWTICKNLQTFVVFECKRLLQNLCIFNYFVLTFVQFMLKSQV
jgi:hypothetical protein